MKDLKHQGNHWKEVLQDLLNQYGLAKKFFAYVKNEGASLYTMLNALKSWVSCEALDAMESF